jgi:hypothetical protein
MAKLEGNGGEHPYISDYPEYKMYHVYMLG